MKIKNLLNSKIVFLLILAVLGYLSYILTMALIEKREIDSKLASLESEIEELEVRKTELIEKKGYFESEDFVEKEARRLLNYQKPGEEVIAVIPSKEIHGEQKKEILGEEKSIEAEKTETSNFIKWWRYFFGERD